MKTAVELLDIIEASHLPVAERLAEQRGDIVKLVDGHLQQANGQSDDTMAAELAELLVGEGVVLSDQDSVQEVISEYLHVVADVEGDLDDEEKNFLDNFLK